MAYVPVPKDLSKVKTKVILGLTKRQIISFSLGGLVGIPVYFFTRNFVGNEMAIILLMITALPFFMAGVFEKDGLPLEKYAKYVIRQKFIYPKIRVYKSVNLYSYLEKEGRKLDER